MRLFRGARNRRRYHPVDPGFDIKGPKNVPPADQYPPDPHVRLVHDEAEASEPDALTAPGGWYAPEDDLYEIPKFALQRGPVNFDDLDDSDDSVYFWSDDYTTGVQIKPEILEAVEELLAEWNQPLHYNSEADARPSAREMELAYSVKVHVEDHWPSLAASLEELRAVWRANIERENTDD